MNIDYKHTWVLPRDSIVIRFYMWLWNASPREVTFCKLFWGYIFAIPALIGRAIAYPFIVTAYAIDRRFPTKDLTAEEHQLKAERRQTRHNARQRRAQQNLQRIETGGARVVMAFSGVWRYLRYPFVIACGLVVLAGIVFFVYQLSTAWADVTVQVLLIASACLTGIIFGALPLALGVAQLANRGHLNWVGKTFEWTAPRILVTVLAPFVFFFWVMKMGFISVKSNTCPRVELSDAKDKG